MKPSVPLQVVGLVPATVNVGTGFITTVVVAFVNGHPAPAAIAYVTV